MESAIRQITSKIGGQEGSNLKPYVKLPQIKNDKMTYCVGGKIVLYYPRKLQRAQRFPLFQKAIPDSFVLYGLGVSAGTAEKLLNDYPRMSSGF